MLRAIENALEWMEQHPFIYGLLIVTAITTLYVPLGWEPGTGIAAYALYIALQRRSQ